MSCPSHFKNGAEEEKLATLVLSVAGGVHRIAGKQMQALGYAMVQGTWVQLRKTNRTTQSSMRGISRIGMDGRYWNTACEADSNHIVKKTAGQLIHRPGWGHRKCWPSFYQTGVAH
jgi:hypothetical protein